MSCFLQSCDTVIDEPWFSFVDCESGEYHFTGAGGYSLDYSCSVHLTSHNQTRTQRHCYRKISKDHLEKTQACTTSFGFPPSLPFPYIAFAACIKTVSQTTLGIFANVLQSVVFSFLAFKRLYVLFFEGPGGHVGAIFGNATNPNMKIVVFPFVIF